MQSGNNFPIISQESVQQALDALIQVSPLQASNPLRFLLCVELFLSNPDLPPMGGNRQGGFDLFLVQTITAQYQTRRSTLHLSAPQTKGNAEQAHADIAADMQLGGFELLAWSWLYHHYVRVDLNLTQSEFAEAAGIANRTIRRYQQIAVQRFKDQLVQIEWSTRREFRQRRLVAELPRAGKSRVIGRSNELDFVRQAIDTTQPLPILITGPPGIGKSVLVEEILKWRIDKGLVDRIVWIENPQSRELVEVILRESLLASESQVSLGDYFLLNRVCVVLDDILFLQTNMRDLTALLMGLSNTLVIMTSREQIVLTDCIRLALAELTQEDSYQLISETFLLNYGIMDSPTNDDMFVLWSQVGGNPLAIKFALRTVPVIALSSSMKLALAEVFQNVYSYLDDGSRYAWCLLALLPGVQIDTKQLLEAWAAKVESRHLSNLIKNCIVESTDAEQKRVVMQTSARNFIASIYINHVEIQGIINDIALSINGAASKLPAIQFIMLESLLDNPWITLDNAQRSNWLRSFWQQGVTECHWGKWSLFLRKYSSSTDFDLRIAYGICLRCLSKWDLAQQTFQEVIENTGRVGAFTEQCMATLELATLLRLQGDYQAAHKILTRSEAATHQYRLEAALQSIRIEQAQVAFDVKRIDDANTILATLANTPRILLMRAELHLAQNDSIRCRETCLELLDNYREKPSVRARILVLLARAYQHENNIDQAIDHFSTAVSILEQYGDDPFALARAHSNLGGLLINIGYYPEARRFLNLAEKTQVQLKDRVGLASTRHNIRLLDRQFPS